MSNHREKLLDKLGDLCNERESLRGEGRRIDSDIKVLSREIDSLERELDKLDEEETA